MDNAPVSMGGILDLATTQSDELFVVKPINCSLSSELDKERIFHQSPKHHSKAMEPLSNYSESFLKPEQSDNLDAILLQSDMIDSLSSKLSSPDILPMDGKPKHISLKIESADLSLQGSGVMISSVCSSLPETPGDSGVLCLDSETSELISECPGGMTLSLVGAEELACDSSSLHDEDDIKFSQENEVENVCKSAVNIKKYLNSDDVMTQSDIENQNITPPMHNFDVSETLEQFNKKSVMKKTTENLPDVVLKTVSCEFEAATGMSETMKSASDDIVYRRKCKKKSNQSQPKKRVSFHEDILNNTKTDNIHIEHGFVSYRPQVSMSYLPGSSFKKQNSSIGRYSWCAVGDTPYFDPHRDISLRNTQSDVLTYGNTDVSGFPDNSGIYEYQNIDSDATKTNKKPCDSDMCVKKMSMCKCTREDGQKNQNDSPDDQHQLYMCSCSSSDSNLSSESETSSSQTLSFNSDTNVKYDLSTAKKSDNTQKSYSCDCIENNILRPMMKTMYFSDADINNHSDPNEHDADGQGMMQMSEILPRASCLKKSSLKKKRYIKTDIIEEHDGTKNRLESPKSVRNLLDSKNLFGSLKNIYKNINFGLTIAERGVPEGSEDCQSVLEVLPGDIEPKSDRSFLSKSFDAGFNDNYAAVKEARVRGDGFCRNFTHEVDDQLRRKSSKLYSNKYESLQSEDEFNNIKNQSDISKQNLTLDMKKDNGKTFIDWKSQSNYPIDDQESFAKLSLLRNKYIVNCESTVYEHKGVSYSYEYDAFQTTFDTSKDTFTPINDNIKIEPSNDKMSEECECSLKAGEDVILKDLSSNSRDLEQCKASSFDLSSETDTLSEKAKLRLPNYILELADAKMSKHLSSPLKQRNIMRYEKASKNLLSDSNRETAASSQDVSNDCSEFEETLEILEGNEMHIRLVNRKASLINRFLKNVCQKKSIDSKLHGNSFFQQKLKEESLKFPNICFPIKEKISPNFKANAKYLDSMINKEVIENKRISVKLMTADEPSYFDSFEENVAIECCEKLKLELFGDSSEVLHRMLKVRSAYSHETGEWTPLLVFITDRALYVADVTHGKSTYNLRCYLTHDQLDIIVIGPDSQYVQIFDKSGYCQCILITGDRYLCHRLVSSLEWSSRNSRVIVGPTMTLGNIPSIIWKKRDCLNRALTKTTSVSMYEGSLFYGMVGSSCSTSCNTGRPASPFGPPLEGFLMYKTEKQKYWRPSLFVLKSGVLSYGATTPQTETSRLPHSIYLDSVLGVRRCTDLQGRPHCFEIALSAVAGGALQMAAPDDDTASQWLQGLLMHAAQALEGPKTDHSKKTLPPCCTLLATSEHIVTLREELQPPKSLMDSDVTIRNQPLDDDSDDSDLPETNYAQRSIEILSCASIKDLTAFKIPDNDDNWCILEFVFCEVREGTEMAFLFGSSAELERFIATVESLWHTTNEGVFPISIIPKSEVVSGKCSEWHDRLVLAWDRMLPAAQR